MALGILIFSAIALHVLSLSIQNSTINNFAIYLIVVIVALVIGMKIYIGLDIEAQTTNDTDNEVNNSNPHQILTTVWKLK